MKDKINRIAPSNIADTGFAVDLVEELAAPLKETHQAKREIIQNAEDLSTTEKLDAMSENDWELIKTYSATAVIVLLFVFGLYGGGEKAIEGLKRITNVALKAA